MTSPWPDAPALTGRRAGEIIEGAYKMAGMRFRKMHPESGGFASQYQILQDTKTGVNYLFAVNGSAGGLTVLLDRDGKPVITPVEPMEYR